VEQAAGMAWVTGFADDRPEMTGGSCDPLAGSHAALSIIFALEHRRRTGEGVLIESPQFTTGLNICAEQIIEYSAHGNLMCRNGNRASTHAPQGAYQVLDWDPPYDIMPKDDWIAISVLSDAQWHALCQVIGKPELSADASLATASGRMQHQDRIDQAISDWCRMLHGEEAVAALLQAGVPAARFQTHAGLYQVPEIVRRGAYEMVDQPVLGNVPIIGYPAQFESGPSRVHRHPAPTLGQHNREILEGVLGLPSEEVDRLEASGIIGNRPRFGTAW
jgi:crotonobetainyl-CoA:carnitine CoA-transferase CaiB-like acyl-CoA transferase